MPCYIGQKIQKVKQGQSRNILQKLEVLDHFRVLELRGEDSDRQEAKLGMGYTTKRGMKIRMKMVKKEECDVKRFTVNQI